LIERCQHRFACHVLKRGSGINQPSVEEHPAVQRACCRSVSKGDLHGATRKSDPVDPGKSSPALANSSFDDSPPRLIYDCVPASTKLGNQCRFSAA
jgi:hypothetical protein